MGAVKQRCVSLFVLRSLWLATALTFAFSEPSFAVSPPPPGTLTPAEQNLLATANTGQVLTSFLNSPGGGVLAESQTPDQQWWSDLGTLEAEQSHLSQQIVAQEQMIACMGYPWTCSPAAAALLPGAFDLINATKLGMSIPQYEEYVLHNMENQYNYLSRKIALLAKKIEIALAASSGGGGTTPTPADAKPFLVPGSRFSFITGGGTAAADLGNLFGLGLPSQQHLTAAIGLYDNETWFALGPVGSGHAPTLNSSIAVTYLVSSNYVTGTAALSDGRVWEQSALGGTGNFGTHGYLVDGTFGHIFTLWSASSSPPPVKPLIVTKAPPPEINGWSNVQLDLAGHVGYLSQTSDSFVDSSGYALGDGLTHATFVGASARLSGSYLYRALGEIDPYLKVSYDNYFAYSSTVAFPAQGGLPATQILFFNDPHNVGTFETGVSVGAPGGMTLTGSGYYAIFNTGSGFGGRLSLNIPLNIPLGR